MNAKYNIAVTQAYLETARSAHCDLLITLPPAEKPKENEVACLAWSLASMTIIYSYLAVESFINFHLYNLWTDAKACHDACFPLQKSDPTIIPRLDAFYREFCAVTRFEDLKRSKGIRELPGRIKTVCEHLDVRPIHEANSELWNHFLNLVEDSRHFLVHPFPDPKRFQEICRRILTNTAPNMYPEVAAGVIGHFYTEKRGEPPVWLEKNVLFRFTGLQLFPGAGC